MCGIVSVISKKSKDLHPTDIKMLQELLFVDQLRGVDGTGIFYNVKKQCKITKINTNASIALDLKDFKRAMETVLKESSFVVGHNRFSTKGGNTIENTHPFKEGNITLVHNGTLHTHKEFKDVENDSLAICHGINERGIDYMLEEMHGAFTLVFHDSSDNSLNIIRNKDRPLACIETGSSWIFCSELEMGLWICKRNKVGVIQSYEIKEGILNKLNLNNMTWETKEKKLFQYYTYPTMVGSYSYPEPKKRYNEYLGKSTFGKKIFFFPTIVKEIKTTYSNKSMYRLEGWVEDEFNDINEVYFYSPNKQYCDSLSQEKALIGIISQQRFENNNITFIVREAVPYVISKNKQLIQAEKFLEWKGTCCTCGGYINLEPKFLEKSVIYRTRKDGKISYSIKCNSCSE